MEVDSAAGSRVLLDLGMPLTMPDGSEPPRDMPQRETRELLEKRVLPDIDGVYASDPTSPRFAAIILTHAHLDHFGLAHHAHPAVPVFGSAGTVAIIDVGRVFFPSAALPADLRVLPDSPVHIGSLTVTAIPVDHAAPDSRALLVEADGQRLLYTGDLRAHGRTGFRFENLLEDGRVRGVDWLLVEGTTLGAPVDSHGLRSEEDVEEELVSLAKSTPDLVAVVSSGQNIDRLVSCFKAAIRSGRQLVVDPYQAYILMRLAPLSRNIPQFTWDGVRVSFAPYQVQRLIDAGLRDLVYEMSRQGKVDSDELAENPTAYLLCCRGSRGVTKLFDKVGPSKVSLVWSIWKGYWDRGPSPMRDWSDWKGVAPTFIHSGGHAWPEDLHRLVERLEPTEVVWVHTEAFRRAPRHRRGSRSLDSLLTSELSGIANPRVARGAM